MRVYPGRIVTAAGLLLTVGLIAACASPDTAGPAAQASSAVEATPVLSVKELMEHIIDPTADWIFDAAVVDVSASGVIETAPVSEEDWLRVERGALLLAESANLLKMRRAMAPAGTKAVEVEPGKPSPELSPEQIQAKVDGDPARWAAYADGLRKVAIEALPAIRAHDAEKLFDIGDAVDKACESCHLEYWYPGDRPLVEADQKKTATFDPPPR